MTRAYRKNAILRKTQTIQESDRLQLPVDLQRATMRRSRNLVITPFVFQISVYNFYSIFSINCTFELSKKKFRFFQPNPHSTVILKEYFENIPLKSCNITKIFIKLLVRFLKYCRNLAMSVHNIINGMLLQY